ncbi:MAG: hypothetical protein F6J90_18850 [Moorea sp. SIOASIH]|uniref:hypothetical protein n=1 Tax=Moorena sp. SIOASIH TaxID=2607817 RepID=UPI0013BB8DF2|nr:hypothetical protein [Moorena sp. SIOASIH]NEO38277.1 hypothetical protein [Moorena sp. SIOASIH]
MKLPNLLSTLGVASIITTLAVVDIPKPLETFAYTSPSQSTSEGIGASNDVLIASGRSANFEDGIFSVRLPETGTLGQELDNFISANPSFNVDSKEKWVSNIKVSSLSRGSISNGSVPITARWSVRLCWTNTFALKKCVGGWINKSEDFETSCSIGAQPRYLRCTMPGKVSELVREGSILVN